MNTFWTLLKESVITQGLITITLIGCVVYLVVTSQEIPDIIQTLTLLVVGYFFGAKVENATTREVVKKFTDGG